MRGCQIEKAACGSPDTIAWELGALQVSGERALEAGVRRRSCFVASF